MQNLRPYRKGDDLQAWAEELSRVLESQPELDAVLRGNAVRNDQVAANGSVATTITSLGPTGAQTTIQGWLVSSIGGALRYIPFW